MYSGKMSPMREETFNMTQQEMKKLRVIDQIIAKNITVGEAARLLNLSERQVLRLKKGVMEQGAAFIIHKNRGRFYSLSGVARGT
jgi:hypothetical protein